MTPDWVTTEDGSLSCRDAETGQLCHNRAGAALEALRNYAHPSGAQALARNRREIRLLDACYGLGYNTWVLIDYLLRDSSAPFSLSVMAIERKPDMLRESPRILEHPSLDALKSKISPSEHNIYYRTLQCLLDNKVSRFKLQLIEEVGQFRFQFLLPTENGDWEEFRSEQPDHG